MSGDKPKILYIDARGAHRSGVPFFRTRSGLYLSEDISLRFVLNADPRFAYQRSAGGALVRGDGPQCEVALILPAKRARDMWELPKGKLGPKESFEEAAVREIQEELGVPGTLSIGPIIGSIRYSFRTPFGEPRLKVVRFYFVRPDQPIERFVPPPKEVREARWFAMPDAIRAVAHDEIRPILYKAQQLTIPPPAPVAPPTEEEHNSAA
jgi:8-oxo-dGTP diphosphatase